MGLFEDFDMAMTEEEKKKKAQAELGGVMPATEEETLADRMAKKLNEEKAPPPVAATAPVEKDVPLLEKVKTYAPKAEAPKVAPVAPKVVKEEKKKEIANKIQAADVATKDAPIEDLVASINEDMPKNAGPEMKWLNKQWENLQRKTDAQKESVEWRQAAETVAQALTRIFAAKAGLKAGVDLSGIRLERTDFDKKLQMLDDQLEKRKAQAEKIAKSAEAARLAGEEEKKKEQAAAAAKLEKEAAIKEDTRRWEEQQKLDQARFGLQKEQAAADRAAQQAVASAKQEAAGAKESIRDSKLVVPGFQGQAATEAEAKELRNAVAEVGQASAIINDIKKLGTDVKITDRERVNLIEQKIGQLAGTLRTSLMGPGAMSDSERTALKDMIGNPAKLFGTESTEIAKLNALEDTLKKGLDRKAAVMMNVDEAAPATTPTTGETPRQKLERLRALKAGK